MNTQELHEYVKALEYPRQSKIAPIEELDIRPSEYKRLMEESKAAYRIARNEYDGKVAYAQLEWAKWLHERYCPHLPENLAGKIYSIAWDHGHSSGYHEVDMYYEEFADLVMAGYQAGLTATS